MEKLLEYKKLLRLEDKVYNQMLKATGDDAEELKAQLEDIREAKKKLEQESSTVQEYIKEQKNGATSTKSISSHTSPHNIQTGATLPQRDNVMKFICIVVVGFLIMLGLYEMNQHIEEQEKAEKERVIEEGKQKTRAYIATHSQQKQAPAKQEEDKVELDPIVGSYYCAKSGDKYVFYSTHDGSFFPAPIGSYSSEFRWKRTGSKVVITFTGDAAGFGSSQLKFDVKKKTLTEHSSSLGTLVFKAE